jgi:hypothetical protein
MRARDACDTPECLRELERKAAQLGDCAERDLLQVQDFFHDALVPFTNCIVARTDVRPVVLGRPSKPGVSKTSWNHAWKSTGIGMARRSGTP